MLYPAQPKAGPGEKRCLQLYSFDVRVYNEAFAEDGKIYPNVLSHSSYVGTGFWNEIEWMSAAKKP